jgi:citrate lyase subunit beta/citryl-CoA lyase
MLRSLLYVPAHRADFLERAPGRGADALILDLEDAVPPSAKISARDGLAHWVPKLAGQGARVFVRINADTAAEDAVAACRAGAHGLAVPKVESAAGIAALSAALTAQNLPPPPMIAMIESPAALLAANDIAAGPGLMGLILGGEDFAAAIGAQSSPAVLRQPKLMLHYVAKAHGLRSFGLLQSVADYTDQAQLTAAVQEAYQHGFDGATCVHPLVVPILNAGFKASDAEIAQARHLIAAMQAAAAAGKAAISFGGRMVDAPMLRRAERIIADASLRNDP